MPTAATTIEGTVTTEGKLEISEPLQMPPGRVLVTVVPLPESTGSDPFWVMLESIWADQRARGFVPRSAEEIDAERRAVRDDWDQRQLAIEALQAESRRLREQSP